MLSARILRGGVTAFAIQVRATSATATPAKTRQSMAVDRFLLPGHGQIVKREEEKESEAKLC